MGQGCSSCSALGSIVDTHERFAESPDLIMHEIVHASVQRVSNLRDTALIERFGRSTTTKNDSNNNDHSTKGQDHLLFHNWLAQEKQGISTTVVAPKTAAAAAASDAIPTSLNHKRRGRKIAESFESNRAKDPPLSNNNNSPRASHSSATSPTEVVSEDAVEEFLQALSKQIATACPTRLWIRRRTHARYKKPRHSAKEADPEVVLLEEGTCFRKSADYFGDRPCANEQAPSGKKQHDRATTAPCHDQSNHIYAVRYREDRENFGLEIPPLPKRKTGRRPKSRIDVSSTYVDCSNGEPEDVSCGIYGAANMNIPPERDGAYKTTMMMMIGVAACFSHVQYSQLRIVLFRSISAHSHWIFCVETFWRFGIRGFYRISLVAIGIAMFFFKHFQFRVSVVSWTTVSEKHDIYVVDLGLTPKACNDLVTTTEQACRGRYAAYTYAKQTLGCREYPLLAQAALGPVHSMVAAIREKFDGMGPDAKEKANKLQRKDDSKTTSSSDACSSSTITPIPKFYQQKLQLDDREPHIVKYDVTRKERRKLDIHTDKSEWTFLIALSDGCGLDYDGGGTYFECLDATVHIQKGHALVFPGKLRHKGQAIHHGLRFLLVGFLVDKCEASEKVAAAATAATSPTNDAKDSATSSEKDSSNKDGSSTTRPNAALSCSGTPNPKSSFAPMVAAA